MNKEQEAPQHEQRAPLTWLELAAELSRTLQAALGNRVPDEFWHHARSARKEELLALRSLVDARINDLEADERRRAERTPTKITVQ